MQEVRDLQVLLCAQSETFRASSSTDSKEGNSHQIYLSAEEDTVATFQEMTSWLDGRHIVDVDVRIKDTVKLFSVTDLPAKE